MLYYRLVYKNYYLKRKRTYIHTIIKISYIKFENFRYTPWPDEALEKVAMMNLKDVKVLSDANKIASVNICKLFHTSVQECSERLVYVLCKKISIKILLTKLFLRFYNEQKRKNYVTPTTYLKLLKTFQILYKIKVEQITQARNRYVFKIF